VAKAWQDRRTLCRQMPWQPTTVSDEEQVVVHSVSPMHNILEPTTGVTFFNSGFKSDPTELFPSIVLDIAGEKRFPPPNFNLKIVRIQRGYGSWMLLDALLHYSCIHNIW
jgi:hypothetical protein